MSEERREPGASLGNGKLVFNGDRVLVWEDEHILEMMTARATDTSSCHKPGGGLAIPPGGGLGQGESPEKETSEDKGNE